MCRIAGQQTVQKKCIAKVSEYSDANVFVLLLGSDTQTEYF